jgi:hypothetical protein
MDEALASPIYRCVDFGSSEGHESDRPSISSIGINLCPSSVVRKGHGGPLSSYTNQGELHDDGGFIRIVVVVRV